MKKLLVIFASASLLLSLNACSPGTTSSTSTVLAQTAYSNASLNGTYSVTLSGVTAQLSSNVYNYSAIGTIQLNGSGLVTGGTLNTANIIPCVANVSGTYSLQSTGLGTANLSLSSTTAGCNLTATLQLTLAAAEQGTSILFGSATSDQNISGVAIKQ